MFGRSRVASLDERDPLLGAEQRVALAPRQVDDRHDDVVEHRRRAADHVEMAVGDGVEGAGADGDAVIGSHGCGSGCRRSGARRAARRSELQRVATVALGDDAGIGGEHRSQRRRELAVRGGPRGGMEGRGRRDRIDARAPCALEERGRRLARHLGLDLQRREVAPDRATPPPPTSRPASPPPRRATAPRSPSAPSRRTDRAPRAPSTSPRIENSASRTRSEVGRVAPPARRRSARRPP